jgi:hypothetical protein
MKISEDDVMKVIELAGTKGISKQDLAKKLGGVDPAYRAEQLIKYGWITKQRDGQTMRYFVKPKSKVVELPQVSPPALMNTNLFKPVSQETDNKIQDALNLPRREGKSTPYMTHPTGLDDLVNELVTAIANKVVERVRPVVIERLRESVAAMTAEVVEKVAPQKEKPKLPSIFIGGLHPDQVHMIEKEFEGVADLRFANSDEHESLWKSRAAKANHTVMMVDFLSHKHVEAVKSTGVKAIVVRGGLTKLRDKLMELSV